MLSKRRSSASIDYWPSFVDAMSTLLLVFVFLLTIFIVAQFYLSKEISGKDNALIRLESQIAELTQLLALERASNSDLEDQLGSLTATLEGLRNENSQLSGLLGEKTDLLSSLGEEKGNLASQLESERELNQKSQNQIAILNQQIAALRRQLASIEATLQASEERDKASQAKIADLGRRLNVALAQKVQELARYRSDFFGKLRTILADRADIQIVGDRFVFQSEVFFSSGAADVSEAGQQDLLKLARALIELKDEIPSDINWILRVGGHTDKRPISGGAYASNWELSTARAIAVVKFLIENGVSPSVLMAAGFGEFQPLDEGDTLEAFQRNRRIELKLTER